MGRIEEHAPEEDLVHLDQCGKGRIDANAKPSKVLPAKGIMMITIIIIMGRVLKVLSSKEQQY